MRVERQPILIETRFITRDARCNSVMQAGVLLGHSKSSGPQPASHSPSLSKRSNFAGSTKSYADAGLNQAFVQDNLSRSVRGTLRGLHFQRPKARRESS